MAWLAISACRDEAPPEPAPALSVAASSASASERITVVVKGDDTSRGVALEAGMRVAVKDLLPAALQDVTKWAYVAVHARDGRDFTIHNWKGGYRGFRAVLYLDGDNPTFGVFQEAGRDNAKWVNEPRTKFGGVQEIEVRSVAPAPKAVSEPTGGFSLIVGDEPHQMTPAILRDVQKTTGTTREAWLLVDVVRSVAPGARIAQVQIATRDEERTLDAAALEKLRPVVRYSGRKELVVELSGDEEKLRGVTEIGVVLAK